MMHRLDVKFEGGSNGWTGRRAVLCEEEKSLPRGDYGKKGYARILA